MFVCRGKQEDKVSLVSILSHSQIDRMAATVERIEAPGEAADLGQGDGPQELECVSCHKVHQSSGKFWDAEAGKTPVSRYPTGELWGDEASEKIGQFDVADIYQAPSMGQSGNDLSGNPLPIDLGGNPLLTDTVLPDYNTLCLSCHQYAFGGLAAIQWTTKKHGSAAADPHLGGDPWQDTGYPLLGTYDTALRGQYFMTCIDCHEAHGSDNAELARRIVNGTVISPTITDLSSKDWVYFCDACHSYPGAARHMSDEVKAKLGNPSCSFCHPGGGDYKPCIDAGCHGHNDRF